MTSITLPLPRPREEDEGLAGRGLREHEGFCLDALLHFEHGRHPDRRAIVHGSRSKLDSAPPGRSGGDGRPCASERPRTASRQSAESTRSARGKVAFKVKMQIYRIVGTREEGVIVQEPKHCVERRCVRKESAAVLMRPSAAALSLDSSPRHSCSPAPSTLIHLANAQWHRSPAKPSGAHLVERLQRQTVSLCISSTEPLWLLTKHS